MSVRDEPASYVVESSELAFASGRVIDVRSDVVRMPDGGRPTRDVVVHPGAVGIIALDDDDRVLMVRQYRHPVRRMLWEPPAGLLDMAGEDPLTAAQRELYEEGHHRASSWSVLVDAFTSPGMSDEAVRIYLARDLSEVPPGERHEGEHEEADMPVAWVAPRRPGRGRLRRCGAQPDGGHGRAGHGARAAVGLRDLASRRCPVAGDVRAHRVVGLTAPPAAP